MSDTQHDNAMTCAQCRYAECCVLFTIMLSVIMLNVVMLSVVAPSALPTVCGYAKDPLRVEQLRVAHYRGTLPDENVCQDETLQLITQKRQLQKL